jgi:hypothetical protein
VKDENYDEEGEEKLVVKGSGRRSGMRTRTWW